MINEITLRKLDNLGFGIDIDSLESYIIDYSNAVFALIYCKHLSKANRDFCFKTRIICQPVLLYRCFHSCYNQPIPFRRRA